MSELLCKYCQKPVTRDQDFGTTYKSEEIYPLHLQCYFEYRRPMSLRERFKLGGLALYPYREQSKSQLITQIVKAMGLLVAIDLLIAGIFGFLIVEVMTFIVLLAAVFGYILYLVSLASYAHRKAKLAKLGEMLEAAEAGSS